MGESIASSLSLANMNARKTFPTMKGMTFRGYGGKWHWTDKRNRFGFEEETSVSKDIIQS